MPALTPTCFVIMPFTVKEVDKPRYPDLNHWTEVYEGLILPAVQQAGLQPERDDRDSGSRLIVEGILRKLEAADLILCDLSSHNANVFLELGWILRADKPFILIKDNLTEYTFDLNQHHTLTYSHSLQPTALRSEIAQLAKAIRSTLDDKERRYSLIKRMAISASAIKAAREGDVQAQLLSDIQQRLVSMQNSRRERSQDMEPFPWPDLLNRATNILFAVRDELQHLEGATQREIILNLTSALRKKGAFRSRDIQVGILDEEKRWVFHDWQHMIGESANYKSFQRIVDEIYAHPHGAVAWMDMGSNLDTPTNPLGYKRMNIGLFSTMKQFDWKILVETHHELEGIS